MGCGELCYSTAIVILQNKHNIQYRYSDKLNEGNRPNPLKQSKRWKYHLLNTYIVRLETILFNATVNRIDGCLERQLHVLV